ncbi:molybdopterin binding domain protein [Obelidium mucronatum]|nr:molybdopterin binding domain protein [Obelidium mucronatum]
MIRRYMSSQVQRNQHNIACLIIGDEVLGGKTIDSNSSFLAKLCFQSGLSLRKIEVVPDEETDIVEAVRRLSSEFEGGHVITSGGIGPTHDDITYSSIAKAFNLSLVQHDPTIALMKQISLARTPPTPFELNTGRLRMATLPTPSAVSFPCKDLWVPIVSANANVHIFPGVPRLFQQLVSHFIQDTIIPSVPGLAPFIRKQIGTEKMESEIADVLTKWQEKMDQGNAGIKIGSYPKFMPISVETVSNEPRMLRVVISVVGRDEKVVDAVISGIQNDVEGAFEFK